MLQDKLGKVIEATITDMNKDAFFVQVDGQTFYLGKNDIQDIDIKDKGDQVVGFVYENQHKQLRMTQHYPESMVDVYGFGTVKEVKRDLGVFIDIGLKDKDIVVSLDDLPLDSFKWPKLDDRLMIRLEIDHKDRIWGKLAEEEVMDQLSVRYPRDLKNTELDGTVYATKQIGAFIVTDEYYLGFIHHTEMYGQALRLGERVKARVIGNGQHGRLNLSLMPRAFEVIDDDAQMIVMMLKRNKNHTLPFYDKSDAELIKSQFGISKASFKRALGNLMKQKLITQDKEKGEIKLNEDEPATND
ncbi:CvfB family protein [Holzapfeliella floricola]|uniref:RNA-binding protein n=1 Tax=Holzapfeliella floricola DSM 23037 = JCM 16512 TaxID=1423744 RepID=A0A0R2DHS9_9LACO|nr:S1-like domain-containing RNA-binding protein [Holzapfeliella floricola]KRN03647.1 RNA-binding protein [Holzapfeliella floricola DSM 23037 = JCM 16512]